MTKLITQSNLASYDSVYERLVNLYDGLSDEESRMINAKLILLLANHIGDSDVIEEAIEISTKK